MSDEFLKRSPSEKKIRFIDIKLIQIPETGEIFSVEEFRDGTFSKWSNNIGFINEINYACTLDAFAHWTYYATNEYLVVSDLQGFRSGNEEYILTDPSISCVERQFSLTDFGPVGIESYFNKHRCNHICTALELKQFGEMREITERMTRVRVRK